MKNYFDSMLTVKRRFFFITIPVLIGIVTLTVYFGISRFLRTPGYTDLTKILQGKLGPGVQVGRISIEDKLFVLDSLEIGGIIKVQRVTAKKDFYSKLQQPGAQPVEFSFENAKALGLILKNGGITLRVLGRDSVEVRFTGNLTAGGRGRMLSAQGHIGHVREFPLVSTDFRVEAPGLNAVFDSLVVSREGECRGSADAEVRPENLQDVVDLPFPARGAVRFKGTFQSSKEGISLDGVISSDTLEMRSEVVRSLSAKFNKRGSQYRVPDFSLKAFGGSGAGSAEFTDAPDSKACAIILNLKNADLNLMPKKPQGLAFEGRFNGRMDFSGKGKSWPEVLRKMKND